MKVSSFGFPFGFPFGFSVGFSVGFHFGFSVGFPYQAEKGYPQEPCLTQVPWL